MYVLEAGNTGMGVGWAGSDGVYVDSANNDGIFAAGADADEDGFGTAGEGLATVTLPDYFEALNSDYRYQLTVIGTFAQAIVAEEIEDNHFVIQTDAPHVQVSWS